MSSSQFVSKSSINDQKPKLELDDDYIDNSIGDVTAGLIANLLVLGYWYYFKELPWFYLIFIVLILALLLSKSSMLYPKEEKN